MKIFNFSAGPSILPAEVIEEAARGVLNIDGRGLSILELSHRGPVVMGIFEETEALLRELVGIPDDYAVLFLSGGASSQFYMAPMNILRDGETAAYSDTGVWANKAIKEAKHFGHIVEVASSKADNYTHIPRDFEVPSDAAYFHFTSNNTIFGTQYHFDPPTDLPWICDMSSDFLSRPIDINRYGLIYAGAQKNLGPSGITIVIVRKDLIGRSGRKLPSMLDYKMHYENASMYNTPPVFPVYVNMLTLRWLKNLGGVPGITAKNEDKAAILYQAIDESPLFFGHAVEQDRSLMNVTFRLHDAELEKSFLALAKERGLDDIKGHRSVGGFRASIYNGMPREGVEALIEAIKDFGTSQGK
jgi:phosphoserine aminotransferase